MAKITFCTVKLKFDRFHNLNKSFEPANHNIHCGLRVSIYLSFYRSRSLNLSLILMLYVIPFSTISKVDHLNNLCQPEWQCWFFLMILKWLAHHRLLFRCVLFLKFCFSLNCTASCLCLLACLPACPLVCAYFCYFIVLYLYSIK